MKRSSGWKTFCQLKLLLNMHGGRIMLEKKRMLTPTPLNSSIFPLLKDVVHTPDMQHHLTKLCIEYTNTLNPQLLTGLDCSDQPIYALSKIIQWKYPKFAFPKYFALFGVLHIGT